MSEQPLPGNRINVVGTSGSGKTTLARRLGEILDCPHIELDSLAFGPNWTMTPNDEYQDRVKEFAVGDRWVACGNYSRVRDKLWPRTDTIIWLDYPFPLVFGRVFRRTLSRCFKGTELWHGNKERLWVQLFTRESILWWVLKTYRRVKRKYARLREAPEYSHLTWVHLKSPQETEAWLAKVQARQVSTLSA